MSRSLLGRDDLWVNSHERSLNLCILGGRLHEVWQYFYLLIDWFIIFHFTHPKQRVPRLLNNNIKTKHRILTSQSFQKIWLESKWYLPFSSSRGKFFGSNRTSKIKVVLFFQMECSRWKFKFPFFKPSLILVSGFCSGFSVLKWNWFV